MINCVGYVVLMVECVAICCCCEYNVHGEIYGGLGVVWPRARLWLCCYFVVMAMMWMLCLMLLMC